MYKKYLSAALLPNQAGEAIQSNLMSVMVQSGRCERCGLEHGRIRIYWTGRTYNETI